jgi:hypothetical protein
VVSTADGSKELPASSLFKTLQWRNFNDT